MSNDEGVQILPEATNMRHGIQKGLWTQTTRMSFSILENRKPSLTGGDINLFILIMLCDWRYSHHSHLSQFRGELIASRNWTGLFTRQTINIKGKKPHFYDKTSLTGARNFLKNQPCFIWDGSHTYTKPLFISLANFDKMPNMWMVVILYHRSILHLVTLYQSLCGLSLTLHYIYSVTWYTRSWLPTVRFAL